MKKTLLTSSIAVATLLGSTSAIGQSKFEGFYGQVGVGYYLTNPTLKNSSLTSPGGTNYPYSTTIDSTNSFNGQISAGYTFNLDKQFTLGLGVDWQPFASQEGNYSQTNSSLSPATTTGKWKVNNAYNIYLAPGIALTPDSLAYLKVGYAASQNKTTPSGGASFTTNYSGYLVGLGYKQLISKGFYGFGEVNYTSFGNQTTNGSGPWGGGGTYTTTSQSNANSFNAIVGVGYKF